MSVNHHGGPLRDRIPTPVRWEVAVVAALGVAGTVVAAVAPLSPPARAVLALAVWALLLGGIGLRRWRHSAATEDTVRMLSGRLEREVAREREAEAALERREGFYRTILEDIPEMIVRWQPDGTVTYVNQAYCRYLGMGRDEVMAQRLLPMFDEPTLARGLTRAHPVSVVEYQVTRPDGEQRWQRWAERAIFDDNGGIREVQSIGADITERKRHEQRTAQLLEENRHLARRALEIQEQERSRMARELHDELGQCITAIRADAEIIRGRSLGVDGVSHESAEAIEAVAGQVYGVVRRMMRQLRPNSLDEMGLTEAVTEAVHDWTERHPDTHCELDVQDDLDRVPGPVATTAYRTVQEALTNVARHAQARNVTVRLQRRAGELSVEVADDGRGMESGEGASGFGLLGMGERVRAVDGELHIDSAPGRGTTIRARLPLEARGEEEG